jgi:hypothetical protein
MTPLGLATIAALMPDDIEVDIGDGTIDEAIRKSKSFKRDYDLRIIILSFFILSFFQKDSQAEADKRYTSVGALGKSGGRVESSDVRRSSTLHAARCHQIPLDFFRTLFFG